MSKLLIVLDTNVLISAAFGIENTTPDQIHRALRKQEYILVTSPEILQEVEEVLNREKIIQITKMTKAEIKKFLQDLIDIAFIVLGNVAVQVVQKDPDDDKFIAAAIEGKADYIVSGDKPLLNIKEYMGIKIISPKDFMRLLKKRQTRFLSGSTI